MTNAVIRSSKPPVLTKDPEQVQSKTNNLAYIGKILLVALSTLGFATLTFYTAGLAINLGSAGAASWKIGLVAAGSLASLSTFFSSVCYAPDYHMFEATEHNLKDVKDYLFKTLKTGLTFGLTGVDFVKEVETWNLITKQR